MSLCEGYCLGDVFIATLVRVGQLYLNLVDYGLDSGDPFGCLCCRHFSK